MPLEGPPLHLQHSQFYQNRATWRTWKRIPATPFPSNVGHQKKHKMAEPCPLTAHPPHKSAHLLIQPVYHPPQGQHSHFYLLQLTLQQNLRQWLLSSSLGLIVGEAPSVLLPDSVSPPLKLSFKTHVLRLLLPPPASPVSCQPQWVSLFPTMTEPCPLSLIPTSLLLWLLVTFIHCRWLC